MYWEKEKSNSLIFFLFPERSRSNASPFPDPHHLLNCKGRFHHKLLLEFTFYRVTTTSSPPDRRGWAAPGLTANSPPHQWTLILPKVSRKKTGLWEVKDKRVGAAGQAKTSRTVVEVTDRCWFSESGTNNQTSDC